MSCEILGGTDDTRRGNDLTIAFAARLLRSKRPERKKDKKREENSGRVMLGGRCGRL